MPHDRTIVGRWRRIAGLCLVVIGGALCLLMIITARWWFGYGSSTWLADLGDGTLYVQIMEPNGWQRPLIGWCGGVNDTYQPNGPPIPWTWTWWTWGERNGNYDKGWAYTVWPVAPLLMLCGVALFWPGYRAHRRRRKNQCPRCGYSRAGLAEPASCPECGWNDIDRASVRAP